MCPARLELAVLYEKELTEETALFAASYIGEDFSRDPILRMSLVFEI